MTRYLQSYCLNRNTVGRMNISLKIIETHTQLPAKCSVYASEHYTSSKCKFVHMFILQSTAETW